MSIRPSGRAADELRALNFERGYTQHAEGSVLVSFGATRVLCTASIEDSVPGISARRRAGLGDRRIRHAAARHAHALGARGRARQAKRPHARNSAPDRPGAARRGRSEGAWANARSPSTAMCCRPMAARARRRSPAASWRWRMPSTRCSRGARIAANPLHGQVAAVSVGIYRGTPVLDLDYAEDSNAETDMNVVMNSGGGFVEVQGTAEGHAFRRHELDQLLDLATHGIAQLHAAQLSPAPRTACRVRLARQLVIATGNAGKLREFRALLAGSAVRADQLGGARAIARPQETGATFLANALLKARHAARVERLRRRSRTIRDSRSTRLAARPGIYSARYAGRRRRRCGEQCETACARSRRAAASSAARATAARWCSCERRGDPAPLVAEGVWEG